MKKLLLLSTLIFLMFTGCKKEEESRIAQTWIVGKWLLVAANTSPVSNNVELNFDSEPNGTYVDINGNTWPFIYSLTTMYFTDVQGNKLTMKKISDEEITIAPSTSTVLTHYKKQ